MYKLTRPDGTDFFSGTINYAENIGKVIRVTDYDGPEKGTWGKGIHASRNPNDIFPLATIPCRAFKVKGIQRIAGDERWARYQAVRVLEEVTGLDKLFGWKYSEAVNPVNPFEIKPPKINDSHIDLLGQWALVWDLVLWSIHDSGLNPERSALGKSLRYSVIELIADAATDLVLREVKFSIIDPLVDSVWSAAWAYICSFFPFIKKWKHVDHKPGEYPFQYAATLWKQGLVPSFDGETWRLHGGEKARVLWEGKF